MPIRSKLRTVLAQKDQLLEICPVVRLGKPIILRGIERPLRQTKTVSACSRGPSLATLRGDHARIMESEQIFSLRCQTEQAEGQEPTANLILANEPDNPVTGMVEPDGIEPTTPCLQSRCSPS